MRETTKAHDRRKRAGYFHRYLKGNGVDVGCGDDPLKVPEGKVLAYDRLIDPAHDAQTLADLPDDHFDFLYSSNCLEQVEWPARALVNWIRVVKPGGYVFFTVPDEDLYEQGFWPSRFNADHQWSWTMHKNVSNMPRSINLLHWLTQFCGTARILSVQLTDTNYDYSVSKADQTLKDAEAFIEVILQKRRHL